jgi:hypothetical protein
MPRQLPEPATRVCVGCGREFSTRYADQRYHDAKCRNAAKARNRNRGRKQRIAELEARLAAAGLQTS